MKKKQDVIDITQYCDKNIEVFVNIKDYNVDSESRFLIPFMYRGSNNGKMNKIGLFDRKGNVVLEPQFDYILDDCYSSDDLIRVGTINVDSSFISYRERIPFLHSRYKYRVINTKGEFVIKGWYDDIKISPDKKIMTLIDRKKGYAVYDANGKEVVPFGKYSWIEGFEQGLTRVCAVGGFGIINAKGEEVIPLEYSNIWKFHGKKRKTTRAEKVIGGVTEIWEINLEYLRLDLLKKTEDSKLCGNLNTLLNHFDEYAGSYAQDVMGYSDDIIDDAFEGDPDAYWNID